MTTTTSYSREYDLIFKLLVVGDSGVGKSSLLTRYSDDLFYDNCLSTIGVDFKFKDIQLEGRAVKLQIWDTAGQEKFRTIVASYYRGAHGIMLVYDTTNEDSFTNLGYWVQEIKRYAPNNCPILLVGTKVDQASRSVISDDRVLAFAQQYCGGDANVVRTSAKTGSGVEQAFEELARRVFKARNIQATVKTDYHTEQSTTILLNDPSSSFPSFCSC